MKTSAMRNQELFNYLSREHGLTLLESEMHEIELIVDRMLANDRAQEAASSVNGGTAVSRAARVRTTKSSATRAMQYSL